MTAIEWENFYKKQCAKEVAEYKAGKRKYCTMKVNYITLPLDVAYEYNKRNDNDIPWFPPIVRKP